MSMFDTLDSIRDDLLNIPTGLTEDEYDEQVLPIIGKIEVLMKELDEQ